MKAAPETLVGADCRKPAEMAKFLFADPEGFINRVNELIEKREPCVEEELHMKDGKILERDYNYSVYSYYGQTSCLLECRAGYFYEMCGCLPYYYPEFGAIWKRQTVCDAAGLECMNKHKRKLDHVGFFWYGHTLSGLGCQADFTTA